MIKVSGLIRVDQFNLNGSVKFDRPQNHYNNHAAFKLNIATISVMTEDDLRFNPHWQITETIIQKSDNHPASSTETKSRRKSREPGHNFASLTPQKLWELLIFKNFRANVL